jgi:hypothetical protein
MDVERLQRRYTDLLLERVEETRFPSNDHLNRIESSLATNEQAERYVRILMEKVEETRYPSVSLLDRVRRVLEALAARETSSRAREDGRR